MTISEAVSRSISEAASPSAGDAGSTPEGAESSSGRRTAALWLVTLLMLGATAVLGYTQWWIPREHAEQVAQVKHELCLEEVKIYLGKDSYDDRLAQCNRFVSD